MPVITVVTPPATPPVTLTEIKTHLRIEVSDSTQDVLLTDLAEAATESLKEFLNRALVSQTVDYTIDRFPGVDSIKLPGGDLQSITSLTYTDSAGSPTVFASSNYFALTNRVPGWLNLGFQKLWPTATLQPRGGIVIRYIVGYGAAAAVPAAIKRALLMQVGGMFMARADVIVGQGLTPVTLDRAITNLRGRYQIRDFDQLPP